MSLKRFGTFEGVFTPCLLSILGVIMYLRLGWVVGQVGLLGTVIIIVIANTITLTTALSMSSIVTNIRIGTGGAYSIITKSLGLELGGAIGVPLYLSQALSVAFYITGFSECWISVFPQHPALLVSLVVWGALLVVTYLSTALAFRLQYAIMGLIGLSLVSIVWGGLGQAPAPSLFAGVHSAGFWKVFAIFFPAVTGVLAGAAMSGELKNPRNSIPRGTLAAIAVSFAVYVALAVWFSAYVSPQELVDNTAVLMDRGRWQWMVVAGIMGATLSSGLSMFVGSPRTLMALGKHDIIPAASSFARLNRRGEPSTAIMMTALLSLLTLLLGSLDSVAGLLTMFFLITYCMINIAVFSEQTIGIVSFRPTFRIPRVVSFLGGAGSLAVMFLINARFSLIAFAVIVALYVVLLRREIKIHSPDIRSGLLVFLAEQFAKAAARLPYHPKIWKPNLLVPVRHVEDLPVLVPMIRAIVFPAGRVLVARVTAAAQEPEAATAEGVPARDRDAAALAEGIGPLVEDGLFVEQSVIESRDPFLGYAAILQAVRRLFFPPNTLFYMLSDDDQDAPGVRALFRKGIAAGMGIVLFKHRPMPDAGDARRMINLWIRRETPNIDLSVLVALQLEQNWDARLRVVQIVAEAAEVEESREYIQRLKKLLRMPVDTDITLLVGHFREQLAQVPRADINIFGMPAEPDLELVQRLSEQIATPLLFLRDSKNESALA